MNYFSFQQKVKSIKDITGGSLKAHRALSEGWFCAMILHPDEVKNCRIKNEPFFYTMAIWHPSFSKIKLMTMDYRKEAKLFWDRFTKDDAKRNKILKKTREVAKNILVIDYPDKEHANTCAN